MSVLAGVVEGEILEPKVHYISQSEVDSRLACERKHWYAFGYEHPKFPGTTGLQPVTHSDSLSRGTIGHKVLEDYYQAIKDGHSRQSAFVLARDAHIKAMGENPHQAEMYSETLMFFTNYHEFYLDEEYEPLVLEYNFNYEIDDDLIFPFKPDAIFRHKPTGKIYIVDHKYLYRFYQERVFPILPQMLRYAKALKLMGYPVSGYIYNMISTDKRAKPENRFKRHKVEFTAVHERKMSVVFSEMIDTMRDIVDDKNSGTNWEKSVKRNMSSFSCANCPFLELCIAELEQQPGVNLMISSFYESNKYGYGKEEVDV